MNEYAKVVFESYRAKVLLIGGENQPGKRTVMLSFNVLRTTHDVDWAKLRDRCGKLMQQREYRGECVKNFATDTHRVTQIRQTRKTPFALSHLCHLCSSAANLFLPIDFDLAIKSIGFILIVFLTARDRMKKMQLHIIFHLEFAQWPQ